MELLNAVAIGMNLLSQLKEHTQKPAEEKEIRMCVLGLDNAGKTTILKSLSHEEI